VVLEQEAQRQVDQLVSREDQKLGNLINPSGNRLATSTEKREAAQRATVQLLARSYKTIEDDTIDRTIALLNETFKTMERDPLIAQTQKIEVTFTVLQNTFTIIKNITKQAMQGGCPELDDIKSTIEALKALYDQYKKWTRDLDKDVRELVELTEEFERLNHADSVQLDKGKKKADEMVKAAIDLEKKMARLRSGRIKNLIKETSQLTIQLRDLLDGLNENAVDTAGIRGLQTQIDNNLDHIEKFDKMMRVAADHLGTVSKAISPEFKFDRNWKEKVAEWWVGRQFDDQRRLRQLLVQDMNEVESLEAELIAITTTNMADAGQCSLLFDNM
jgi:archaellum component FlaC